MGRFWSKLVNNLTPYIPGEQPKLKNLVKLNTNENPYSPSPKVLEALITEVNGNSLRLYPDPNVEELKSQISDAFQVKSEQVFLGNGSDEVLAHAFQALLKQKHPILFPDITYSFYSVYCKLYEINYREIPLTADFEISIEDYRRFNGGIVFANPNALTGKFLSMDKLENLLKFNQDSVVLVDEAYIDFGGVTASKFIKDFPNLLIVQTFSKSRSLAGLRIGFAVGDSNLIEALERVKNSFNPYPIDRMATKAAIASMQDVDYFESTCSKIILTRESLARSLRKLNFQVIPSKANFLLVRHQDCSALALYHKLRERNIVVRHFPESRVAQFLRITIGTEEESLLLLNALEIILNAKF